MDLSNNKINVDQEKDGIWINIDVDTRIKIARYLNPNHKRFIQKRLEPYKRMVRLGTLSKEVEDKVETEAMANCVLVDWEGLKDGGKDVPYSIKTAEEYLGDPKLSWFRDLVQETASDLSLFRQSDIEEATENVKK